MDAPRWPPRFVASTWPVRWLRVGGAVAVAAIACACAFVRSPDLAAAAGAADLKLQLGPVSLGHGGRIELEAVQPGSPLRRLRITGGTAFDEATLRSHQHGHKKARLRIDTCMGMNELDHVLA